MQMKQYMLDTNIFNSLLDGSLPIEDLVGKATFFATHIQADELSNTSDDKRRESLLQLFADIKGTALPTESFVLDVSRLDQANLGGDRMIPTESARLGISQWGRAKWTAPDNLFDSIRSMLNKLNRAKPNNIMDALIAETAIKNGLTLVTHDSDLFHATTHFGGACINVFELHKELTEFPDA